MVSKLFSVPARRPSPLALRGRSPSALHWWVWLKFTFREVYPPYTSPPAARVRGGGPRRDKRGPPSSRKNMSPGLFNHPKHWRGALFFIVPLRVSLFVHWLVRRNCDFTHWWQVNHSKYAILNSDYSRRQYYISLSHSISYNYINLKIFVVVFLDRGDFLGDLPILSAGISAISC